MNNWVSFVGIYIGIHLMFFWVFKYYQCANYLKANGNKIIEHKHKEFARVDMNHWTILKCSPYLFSYLPRVVFGLSIAAIGAIFARLAMIGVDDVRTSKALGVRFVRKYFKLCMLIGITNGYGYTKFNCQKISVDYSNFLGPDWEPEWSGTSTIVSNHNSFVDAWFLLWKYQPCLTLAASIKKLPFVGPLLQAIGAIFVYRKNDFSCKANPQEGKPGNS